MPTPTGLDVANNNYILGHHGHLAGKNTATWALAEGEMSTLSLTSLHFGQIGQRLEVTWSADIPIVSGNSLVITFTTLNAA